MYIAIFDASFIVPVLLYKLFFVNLVFSVLGSSLLRCAVFHVLSSIDENKDEGKSGATGTSVQNIQHNTLVESHLILTEVIWKIIETKKIM